MEAKKIILGYPHGLGILKTRLVQAISLELTFSKAQSSKLERLF